AVIAVPAGPARRAAVHDHRPRHVVVAVAVDHPRRVPDDDPAIMATVVPAVLAAVVAPTVAIPVAVGAAAVMAAVAVVLAVAVVAAMATIVVAAGRRRRQCDHGQGEQQGGKLQGRGHAADPPRLYACREHGPPMLNPVRPEPRPDPRVQRPASPRQRPPAGIMAGFPSPLPPALQSAGAAGLTPPVRRRLSTGASMSQYIYTMNGVSK